MNLAAGQTIIPILAVLFLPRKLKTLRSVSKAGRFEYQLSHLLSDDESYLLSLGLDFLIHKNEYNIYFTEWLRRFLEIMQVRAKHKAGDMSDTL